MADRFHYARITDAVHGTFGLSELETDIISTPVFQRLHNVRQLGLAHLVYPGADYSRFAHSLGACHIAGRMLRSINQNSAFQFDDHDVQMYRVAGLLHDLGHYPFSHAMELAALDHYTTEAYLAPPAGAPEEAPAAKASSEGNAVGTPHSADDTPPAYHHEPLGRAVLEYDDQIAKVLSKHNFSSADLKAILSREKPGALTSLVSSDLDCDRLDYLMRTAHSAGLPYGMVDIEYITTQVAVDSQGRLCLTKKSLRAADHLLVSRYYDYTQVVFHKTVVALEIVLRDIVQGLLKRGLFDCSAARIKAMIIDGTFASFDDQFMIARLRAARREISSDDTLCKKIDAVLNRRPPKLVASHEQVATGDTNRRGFHKNLTQQLREKVRQASEHFGIESELWHVWNNDLKLTKIGSRVPFSSAADGEFEEEIAQAVRILQTDPSDPNSSSTALVEIDRALMKPLSDFAFYAIRVYVHLPEGDTLRRDIEAYFRAELPDFPFAY